MSPRRRKLALADDDSKLTTRVVEAPSSSATDLAAAHRALRVLARWMVARSRKAEEASQARPDSQDLAPQPPSRKPLDFPASKRTPVTR